MVYNTLMVHVLYLELGLIIIGYIIVGFSGVPQADIFQHFAGAGQRGSLKILQLLS